MEQQTHAIDATLHSDAIRTAEQIRANIGTRPATILIGGLDSTCHAPTVTLQIAQACATLGDESTLLIDLDPTESGLVDRIKQSTTEPLRTLNSKEAPCFTQVLPKLAFTHTSLEEEPSNQQLMGNLQLLKQVKEGFALTIIHISSFNSQEGYALLNQVDFPLVTLKRGDSKLGELNKLHEYCQSITKSPLATLLCG